MIIAGVSCLFHDAALSVIDGDQILYASHSERYSRNKNDALLHTDQLRAAQEYGPIDLVVYYETPWKKRLRQWITGERRGITAKTYVKQLFPDARFASVGHHESHAAAGYFTSPFDEATIIVADAIGEWDTFSVWHGKGRTLTKVHCTKYPHSLGLLYSAFTKRCGLKPNEEEYIFMGMAAYGQPRYADAIREELLSVQPPDFRLQRNVHLGLGNWKPGAKGEDLAASMQLVLEEALDQLFCWAARTVPSKNLVYMGGVALNCMANAKLASRGHFDAWWTMPNPGDAGSSLGAALAHQKTFVEWRGPYLGTEIKREVDLEAVVQALLDGQIIGVANGKAEFGPRALGNRSLLADPRRPGMKDQVNAIKHRQKFRPFAPAILEEDADQYFTLPLAHTPYMQFVAPCKKPEELPAVCHVDGTSRVQTVAPSNPTVLRRILERWKQKSGCPALLNTSLNIRGQPLVNTWADAQEFQKHYGVQVF